MNINAIKTFSGKSSLAFGTINEFAAGKLASSYQEKKISNKEFKQGIRAIENDISGDIVEISHHAKWPNESDYPYSVLTPKTDGHDKDYTVEEFDTLAAAGAYANLFVCAVKTNNPKNKADYINKMTQIFFHHAERQETRLDTSDKKHIAEKISWDINHTKEYLESEK